jgi:glyoxylase-like metal-dependent hydrolase (beta-lactamase superfamily II)
MQSGLEELNLDLEKTDFFITHLHADHSGLISKLVTDTSKTYFNGPDAELLANEGRWESMFSYLKKSGFPEDELLGAFQNHPGYNYRSTWIPALSILKSGDTLRIGDYVLKCTETPGHTVGHTCLYEPIKKFLVAGDHILCDITPNIQCRTEQGNPLRNYLRSLDKIYEFEIDLVLPGHRRLFSNHRERIEELKDHHRKRLDEGLSILDKGSKNAYQIASEMTWDINYDSWEMFPASQKLFAVGEAIAHLRYLEEEGKILQQTGTPVITYTLNH